MHGACFEDVYMTICPLCLKLLETATALYSVVDLINSFFLSFFFFFFFSLSSFVCLPFFLSFILSPALSSLASQYPQGEELADSHISVHHDVGGGAGK